MMQENAAIGAVRVTRARSRALEGVSASSRTSFKKERKREVSDYCDTKTSDKTKNRVALTDVTNICKNSQVQTRRGHKKRNRKVASDVSTQVSSNHEHVREKLAKDSSTVAIPARDSPIEETMEDRKPLQPCMFNSTRESVKADPMLSVKDSVVSNKFMCPPEKDIDMLCEKLRASDGLGIVDIDSDLKDPQFSSSYATDIYQIQCVRECERRPLANYMDKLQQDITSIMRGILVDWLVEVCEEYKLGSDTLYLAVNLIDRFLSVRLIQKQRLQLLGVTCVLISSKYEEICAPRVEDFCFITDNTYTKDEVLRMESEVLNLLHFQISVPTTKTFLRRFILAAQSSCKVPCVELEFLASYLAELTLVEYSFLQFLPSLIAASAVLLAKWTLNQSEHPWNPTLEHYTNYKASELKTTVLALADLQLNTKGCCLNAIREKYRQPKFMSVASLSPKPVQSLFPVQM